VSAGEPRGRRPVTAGLIAAGSGRAADRGRDNVGAHMSIAGGLPNALRRGREAGCSVVQIFLKNQVQWAGRPLLAEEVAEFRREQAATGIRTVFAHATYLINLAAPDEAEWLRAIGAFHDELERAERLGLPFVVIHPGSHRGAGREAGVGRVARALDDLHARTAGYHVRIALENTAGAGNLLGARAEELGLILDAVRTPERVAVCLDTCHLFAAGYDIRTPAGLAATLERFHAAVGLERIVAFHLNDARDGLGSGLDRHQHIGRGHIGPGAFRALLRDPRLRRVPMALETPKEDRWDQRNLATLRRLRAAPAAPRVRR
jgi:deoxyribonuclease IV